ncbi:MAG: 16S rRNA (cytosine(1402)-N(4))-methyltransferase RsmH [bacterium]
MRDLDSDIFLGVFLGAPDMPGSTYHVPVMARQVKAFLQPAPGRLFLDGTAGGGGHSALLLQAGAEVIGLDQDPQALAECRETLKEFGARARFVEANFRNACEALDALGEDRLLHGALLDIGVSSHQLDEADRGFSFLREGPLDMRMGPCAVQSAADALNTLPLDELIRIFKEYGEEPNARRIAARIVEVRSTHPLKTTSDLVKAVESVSPRRGPKHPATKIFQALRIHVNDELNAFREALHTLPARMAPRSRLAVITFHSLEDRIAKVFFREHSREWIDRPEWAKPRRNPDRLFKLLTPHPITPSEREIQRNPRSRSAKLRVVEKI